MLCVEFERAQGWWSGFSRRVCTFVSSSYSLYPAWLAWFVQLPWTLATWIWIHYTKGWIQSTWSTCKTHWRLSRLCTRGLMLLETTGDHFFQTLIGPKWTPKIWSLHWEKNISISEGHMFKIRMRLEGFQIRKDVLCLSLSLDHLDFDWEDSRGRHAELSFRDSEDPLLMVWIPLESFWGIWILLPKWFYRNVYSICIIYDGKSSVRPYQER